MVVENPSGSGPIDTRFEKLWMESKIGRRILPDQFLRIVLLLINIRDTRVPFVCHGTLGIFELVSARRIIEGMIIRFNTTG